MKGCFFLSVVMHGAFLALILASAALLSKPRMSYYSIDLFSSLPSGPASPIPVTAAAPAPSAAPLPPAQAQPKPVSKDAIRVPEKRKKPLPAAKPRPRSSAALNRALQALESQTPGGSGNSGSGAGGTGVVGEAGTTFPYPWYLKAIADKLNSHWRPPQEFSSDTVCRIAFVISRSGEVSGTVVEKPSGDSSYDQLAMRAVLYSSPLPPLPNGFPDETLRVHMKFVGKQL